MPSASKGLVFDILRFSTRDGPGLRTTVFLKGCPLRCAWCHNPESQAPRPELMLRPNLCIACEACLPVCPQGAISIVAGVVTTNLSKCIPCPACAEACYADGRVIVGREMTAAAVMAEVLKDAPVYEESGGGVTFSGGEPLQQAGFLRILLQECRRLSIHTVLDTCGLAPWPALDAVRGLVDLFHYDLKLVDNDRHRQFTGAGNARILSNLEQLSSRGHRIVLRVPVVPGVNDDPQSVRLLGEFAGRLPHLERLDLLPYHNTGAEKYRRLGRGYPLAGTPAPSPAALEAMAEALRVHGLAVKVGD